MTDAFAAAPRPRLPVAGREVAVPVNRIFCVGRNYNAHAKEMGAEVERDAPFYFTKSLSAVHLGGDVPFPSGTDEYHHEFELVLVVGRHGSRVPEVDALDIVYGWCAGLDMTRRDLQARAKERRLPWDTAKDVEAGCILAPLVPTSAWTLENQRIHLTVNDETRQDATLGELIWSVPEIIAHLSTLYTLAPGDVIMTGTPAGVGAVQPGDVLKGQIDGLPSLGARMGPRP